MSVSVVNKLLLSPEDNSKDENKERGNWSGKIDSVLALMGSAIGLGNLWRFPYLCYRNGGGAFLLPYLFMLVILGLPLFLMQAALAQYSSSGPTKCWDCAPFFKGIGYAMMVGCFVGNIYYNVVLAWAAHFFFASFTSDLPWQHCNQPWNTENCMENALDISCTNGNRHGNGTCEKNGVVEGLWNRTLYLNVTGMQPASPAREYFIRRVLRMSGGVGEGGLPEWDLVLCYLFTWILCFLCMAKGIKTSGRVVYVTATLPFLLMVVFLIRGVTLEHALSGIYYFIVPDFRRLATARVWQDAAMQVFYSMSLAGGAILALCSYNRFHNNIVRDTVVVAGSDLLASLLAGFVIFSYLGHVAGILGVDIADVALSGSGLAFEVYPMAVTKLPLPTLWSLLFFLMLLMLGLDSTFAMMEVVLTGILDMYPTLRHRKPLVVFLLSAVSALIGISLCGPSGVYWLTLLDNHVGGWSVCSLCILVYIAVIPIYGPNRLYKDMEVMLGHRPSLVWKIFWVSVTPLTLVFIVVFLLVDYSVLSMGGYTFPAWSEGVGWMMTFICLSAIPAFMIYEMVKLKPRPLLQRVRVLLQPTIFWGPALVEHRRLVTNVPGFLAEPTPEGKAMPTGVHGDSPPLLETSSV